MLEIANFYKPFIGVISILILASCDILKPDSSTSDEEQTAISRFENAKFVADNPEYLEAIQLAFWHEGGLMADPHTAHSFLKQRNAIRYKYSTTFPEVERYFTQPFRPGQISIAVDITMTDQAADPKSEFYADVDPDLLPDSVTITRLSIDRPYHRARLYFSKLYNPEVVAQAYSGLPGVFWSEPVFLMTLGGFPVTAGLIDGQFYYVFSMGAPVTQSTTIIRVISEASGHFRAELVVSGGPVRDDSWDERFLELIRTISRQYYERYYERYKQKRWDLDPSIREDAFPAKKFNYCKKIPLLEE